MSEIITLDANDTTAKALVSTVRAAIAGDKKYVAFVEDHDVTPDNLKGYAAALEALREPLHGDVAVPEAGARALVESLALALQAAVLLRAGSPLADAFCRSRLAAPHALAFGALQPDVAFAGVIDRAL